MYCVRVIRQAEYQSSLFKLSHKYVETIRLIRKENPESKKHLDHPNVHRLIELEVHTIPLYEHAILIAELVFESAHQPLKASQARSTNPNAHIHAVQLNLLQDWLGRVLHTFQLLENCRKRILRVFGPVFSVFFAANISYNNASSKPWIYSVSEEITFQILNILSKPIINRLKEWYGSGHDCWDEPWVGLGPKQHVQKWIHFGKELEHEQRRFSLTCFYLI